MAGDPQAREQQQPEQANNEAAVQESSTGDGTQAGEIDAARNDRVRPSDADQLVPDALPGANPVNVDASDEGRILIPPPAPVLPSTPASPPIGERAPMAGDGGAGQPPDGTVAEASEPRKASSTRVVLREIIETALLALLVFLAVRASFQNFKVDGESMMPTLHNGQFMIVNKLVYSQVDAGQLSRFIPFLNASPHEKRDVFHGPQRGDIVVLVNPRETNMDLVKRVIGLPGDTIEILDGHVYINDHLLIEPYIKVTWHYTGPKITIPPNEYFVMGDNRSNSLDSRSQQVGLIPRNLIIGKAMLSYWPLSQFGLAPNASPKLSPTQTTPKVAGGQAVAGGA